MNKLKAPDWIFLCSLIASGGLAGITQAIGQTWPAHSAAIANVASIAVALAGFIVRLYANPTDKTPTSIAEGAPVLSSSGEVLGTNVSTTSTIPIKAPTQS